MRNRYSLTALRAFEAAGRMGSLAEAARELMVTRPAISKQIRLLEEELDCRLFRRLGSKVVLTEAGQELLTELTRSFDLMMEAADRAKRRTTAGTTLRILVESDFATSWLVSNIGRFLIELDDVSVDLIAERQGNFRLDEDFAFRIFYADRHDAEKRFAGLPVRELCSWLNLPLCAPAYVEDSGSGPEPDLHTATLLHDRDRQLWTDWLIGTGRDETIASAGGTTFNGTSLCLAAAESGAGIAIGDSFVAFSHLKEGKLVAPFAEGVESPHRYYLVYGRNGIDTPAKRAFELWITNELETHVQDIDRLLGELGVSPSSLSQDKAFV